MSRDVKEGDIHDQRGIEFQEERKAHANYLGLERMCAFVEQREATGVGLSERGGVTGGPHMACGDDKESGCYSKAKRSHWRAFLLEVARLGSDSCCLDF